MPRPPFSPHLLADPNLITIWARFRNVSFSLARIVLVCYLLPLILLVFAIGGLAIGAVQVQRLSRVFGDRVMGRSSSPRGLITVPLLPRKSPYTNETGGASYRKPRCVR